VVTFRLFGEKPPTAPIETKICMVGHLADVITYAKFQDDIFRGYDFTGGRISHFPIDYCMGLTTVQRDCAACDYVTAPLLCLSLSLGEVSYTVVLTTVMKYVKTEYVQSIRYMHRNN